MSVHRLFINIIVLQYLTSSSESILKVHHRSPFNPRGQRVTYAVDPFGRQQTLPSIQSVAVMTCMCSNQSAEKRLSAAATLGQHGPNCRFTAQPHRPGLPPAVRQPEKERIGHALIIVDGGRYIRTKAIPLLSEDRGNLSIV
jgi:hypothetical protein